jgi:hypothetical protein
MMQFLHEIVACSPGEIVAYRRRGTISLYNEWKGANQRRLERLRFLPFCCDSIKRVTAPGPTEYILATFGMSICSSICSTVQTALTLAFVIVCLMLLNVLERHGRLGLETLMRWLCD